MIRQEYGVASLVQHNNHWIADRDVRRLDAELRRIAPDVLCRYPRSLLLSTAIGIGKAALGHNVGDCAYMSHRPWVAPGLENLRRGNLGTFGRQLIANQAVLVGMFVWQQTVAVLLLLGGLASVLAALRIRPWRVQTVCLWLVVGYYLATIAVVGLDAYARHRSMIVPLSCILAAAGVSTLWRQLRAA
jgi:hypothetical protein